MALRSDYPKNHLLNCIKRGIYEATDDQLLLYQPVDPEPAQAVLSELDGALGGGRLESITHRYLLPTPGMDRDHVLTVPYDSVSYNSVEQTLSFKVKPSKIHDSHQPWLTNALSDMRAAGVISAQENENLRILSGSRFDTFFAPYTTSRKEPDQCILPRGCTLPTIVVESGWSESRAQLHRDLELWLRGGVNAVNLVIILKWTKSTTSREVRGDVEVFDLDPATNQPRCLQSEITFPVPPAPAAASQRIPISRHQLFGASLPQAASPGGMGYLNLRYLRDVADEYLRQEGYIPAV